MLGQYNRIEKVICEDGYETFLLTGDNPDYEVDMKSDFWFNELKIINRKIIQPVSTLNEVIHFCNENQITFNACGCERLTDNTLQVGGEADMIVNSQLGYDWKQY